jgi:hypothetical protein
MISKERVSSSIPVAQTQKLKSLFKNENSFDDGNNAEDRRQKNWDKLIKKISFEPPNDDFYSSYPVKPGFWFWKQLAMYDRPNNELRIRIPDTFVVLGNNNFVWLSYSEKTGKIERKNELQTTQVEFENAVKRKLQRTSKTDDCYLFVHRSAGRIENEISKNVFTKSQCDPNNSGSPKVDYPSMLQEYIYPKGPNAAITRICFKTSNSRDLSSSYGFKLVNYQLLHDPSSKLSISRKATICKDAVDSFEFTPLFTGAVDSLKSDLEGLVKFMERAYHVILTEIVADFIIDAQNRTFLFNVKAIKMDSPGIKINKNLDELSCSVYCKLCGNIFKKDDASKILTYKLLWEFEKHLKKRGIVLKDIDLAHNSTRPCRVCDLCYDVVVAEHKLIDQVQKFALAQNIPLKDLFVKVPNEKSAKNRPVLLSNILRQWRLLFYIKEMKFEVKSASFLSQLKLDSRILYFQLRVGHCKACFPVQLKKPTLENGNFGFTINILKLVYFFSEPAYEIAPFLKETEIHFRITENENWHSEIASGSTKTLTNFQTKTYEGQKHENMVYLFFKNNEFASLKIIVGLVSDGECSTASMNLYKFSNVYFPEDDFYSCNIFPSQWIEIFSDDCTNLAQKIEQEIEKKDEFKFHSKLEVLKNGLLESHQHEKRLHCNLLSKAKSEKRPLTNFTNLFPQTSGKKQSQLNLKENVSEASRIHVNRMQSALPKLRLQMQSKRKIQSFHPFTHDPMVGPSPPAMILPDMNKFINQWLDEKQHEDSLYSNYTQALVRNDRNNLA